jgi:hypothetical protein
VITNIDEAYQASYRIRAVALLASGGLADIRLETEEARAVADAFEIVVAQLEELTNWLDGESVKVMGKSEPKPAKVANKVARGSRKAVRS